jgi:acetoin utilization protein AcuB
MKSAEQVMSQGVISIHLSQPMDEAYLVMKNNNIRHLAVHDDLKRVVGIISDRDVQRAMKKNKNSPITELSFEFDEDDRISDYMNWDIKEIAPTETLSHVIDLMLNKKISTVLVAEVKSYPIGIITTDDMLRLLKTLLHGKSVKLEMPIMELWGHSIKSLNV